jgi:hypothetical protein
MAIMFMLAIVLITGLACQLTTCDICGTYVNQENLNEYLELRKSGVFSLREFSWYIHGNQYDGTWVEGESLVTLEPGDYGQVSFNVEGDTLTFYDDAQLERWVKQ